ncbi:MAG: hypothetical protein ACRDI2_17875, partial [Chloroflexota bacterium]
VWLYYTKLPLDRPRRIVRLSVRPAAVPEAPEAILRVYGLGVGQPDWQVSNVLWSDRERFVLAYEDDEVRVYRNERALPRAYLVPLAVRAPRELHLKEMAERGFDPERMLLMDAPPEAALEGPSEALGAGSWLRPPAGSTGAGAVGGAGQPAPATPPAVVTEDEAGRVCASAAGRVRVVRYTDERVVLDVNATRPAWLFLADTFDPSWRAYVDGAPRPIHLANALFRTVAVPAGRHTVEFRYESAPVRRGALITVATGTLVLIVAGAGLARSWQSGRRSAPGRR